MAHEISVRADGLAEYVDHQSNNRGKDDLARRENRMSSLFSGPSADLKAKAFALAVEMAA